MALSAANYEINSLATAGNVNGGGFNPANTHGLTNGSITGATGNSPVLSTASYSFVAADVGAKVYFKTQTNMVNGYYTIVSVSGGAATLAAAIGQVEIPSNGPWLTNTVAGCATTASPTSVTFLVDYSRSTSAILSLTDLASLSSSTNLTSVTGGFTPVMVGNYVNQSNTGTGGFGIIGWYEIVSYTNTNTVVTDRTTNTGTAEVAVSGKIGGALSLGASNDASVFNLAVSSSSSFSRFFIVGGAGVTYALGAALTVTATGNQNMNNIVESYTVQRGNRPSFFATVASDVRPIIAAGANTVTWPSGWTVVGLFYTSTASPSILQGIGTHLGCKVVNSSSTSGRVGFSSNGNGTDYVFCEGVSYRGIGFSDNSGNGNYYGCYAHDSSTGFQLNENGQGMYNCISACNTTAAIGLSFVVAASPIIGCTLYGAENKMGTGISGGGNSLIKLYNNLIYGFVTGISFSSAYSANQGNYNDYFNNTTDVNSATNFQKGANDVAVNPSFTNVVQLTGTTATTTSGNHLVDSTANFVAAGVTPGQDFLYIISGTGLTTGVYGILSVDSATQITTDIALVVNATANTVWQITTGRNFLPTGAI